MVEAVFMPKSAQRISNTELASLIYKKPLRKIRPDQLEIRNHHWSSQLLRDFQWRKTPLAPQAADRATLSDDANPFVLVIGHGDHTCCPG